MSSPLPVPLNVHIDQLSVPIGQANAGLPVPNPTKSFWQTETLDVTLDGACPVSTEGSEGELTSDADICIIGSGITGVSAAYHLARHFAREGNSSRSARAVILDAREFCNGATGRNGGHLTALGHDGFVSREALYGRDDALRQLMLEDYNISEMIKLIKELHLEDAVDLISGGFLYLFFTEEEHERAKTDVAAATAAGANLQNIEWLTKEDTQQRYGAAYPGILLPGNNLWPRKFVSALYTKAQHLTPNFSLALHTQTPVTSILPTTSDTTSHRRWRLSTPRGSITCSHILHATNAYVSHLLPYLHGPAGVVPGRGQIMAVRASQALSKTAFGANDGFEYWFPRPVRNPHVEERPVVIIGGGRETAGPGYELYEADDSVVNEDVGRAMRGFLPAVFPGMFERGAEPEMEWSGIMGFTKSGDPFVGPVVDPTAPTNDNGHTGQYVCAGFSGHGMPRAYACAEIVAGMIASAIGLHLAGAVGTAGWRTRWTPPSWIPLHYLTRSYE